MCADDQIATSFMLCDSVHWVQKFNLYKIKACALAFHKSMKADTRHALMLLSNSSYLLQALWRQLPVFESLTHMITKSKTLLALCVRVHVFVQVYPFSKQHTFLEATADMQKQILLHPMHFQWHKLQCAVEREERSRGWKEGEFCNQRSADRNHMC